MSKTLESRVHETCITKVAKARSVTLALPRLAHCQVVIIVDFIVGGMQNGALDALVIYLHSIK